jgi:hypothetical protein
MGDINMDDGGDFAGELTRLKRIHAGCAIVDGLPWCGLILQTEDGGLVRAVLTPDDAARLALELGETAAALHELAVADEAARN